MKDKTNKIETNIKNENIRDLCRGKGYKGKTYLVKDENGDRDTNIHIICNMSQHLSTFYSFVQHIQANIHDSFLDDILQQEFQQPAQSQ